MGAHLVEARSRRSRGRKHARKLLAPVRMFPFPKWQSQTGRRACYWVRGKSRRSLGGDALKEVEEQEAPQEAVGASQQHLLRLCGQLLSAHCIGHLQEKSKGFTLVIDGIP